jgi:hypothetical protein
MSLQLPSPSPQREESEGWGEFVEENEEQIEDYSETNMSQQHLWELK